MTQLEREADDSVRVLTERECRRLEGADDRGRYSVELVDRQRRWPDVVVEHGPRKRAIEIEFAPKGSARLAKILATYRYSRYDETLLFVRNAALGRRLAGLVREADDPVLARIRMRTPTSLRVLPWPGLPHEARERLARALGA